MSDDVFRRTLSPGQGHRSIHLILVALEQCDVVSELKEIGNLQSAVAGLLKRTLGLVESILVIKAGHKTVMPEYNVGIGRDLSLGHFDHSVESAGPVSGNTPQ